MKSALITIAIPLYNHEAYIQTALEGVLAQNLPNIELLLIDDGSKDEGFRVAKEWEALHGPRFVRTWFEQQANAGITRTMDRLIRHSRGEFILLLASDDVLIPGSIEKRLTMFEDRAISAIFGDAIPIDEAGRHLGDSAIGGLGEPADRAALRDPRTLLWELIFRWNVYGSVLMCRRNALVTEDGTSVLETGIYSEDMQLYYQLAARGGLRYLDEPVALYRIHSANTHRTPENLDLLRKNIYQSRKLSAGHMSFAPRTVVRLQAFTYLRWRGGIPGLLAMPFVGLAYGVLVWTRILYDLYRTRVLRQSGLPLFMAKRSPGREP